MDFNKLSKEAHANAVKHGFWEMPVGKMHCLMLIITEIGEMVEADRSGRHANYAGYNGQRGRSFDAFIKDTVEDEMADVVIRLCDLAGALNMHFEENDVSIDDYPFQKFTFVESAYVLTKGICSQLKIEDRIRLSLEYVTEWAKYMGVELEWHVTEKMKYNAARPPKNGKAY
mgnify:FL=1